MRDFNDADRQKKNKRVQSHDNLKNLTAETSKKLESRILASLKERYLPCGIAFKIAAEENVPKIVVGEMADKLGHRITNCQIGCFKVDKTVFDSLDLNPSREILAKLEKLLNADELTCVNVFELAKQIKVTPMLLGNTASLKSWKVRQCQLGCF